MALALAVEGALWSAPPTGRIVASPNGHFLQYEDGRPFFWLADTAWLMFSKLSPQETETYLEDRRRKGFNVVQVMLLRGTDAMGTDASRALIDGDPARPDLDHGFWDHVDRMTGLAAEKGIYLAIVPAWGAVVKSGRLNLSNMPGPTPRSWHTATETVPTFSGFWAATFAAMSMAKSGN